MLSRIFAISVILAILIGAGSVFYYFVVYTPKLHKENQVKLDACLKDADNKYQEFWKAECASLNKAENCRLPQDVTERIDTKLNELKEVCFKKFPTE